MSQELAVLTQIKNKLPVGEITTAAYVPNGFLNCDGLPVSRTTYLALFNAIGTTYGVGDGSTTFNVPLDIISTTNYTQPLVASTSLAAATYNHTTSLLADGRILVVGGYVAAAATANTYFGTISGNVISWVAGTALPVATYSHASVVLADGRILVTGGYAPTAATANTYFGTITGNAITWVAGTALSAATVNHTINVSTDGRVLVIGGYTTTQVANTYFGTIATNAITWAAGTALPAATWVHTAKILADGRVLVVGGLSPTTSATANTYFGTIAANAITWVSGTALPVATSAHGMNVMPNGTIIISGGLAPTAQTANTYVGTISTNTIAWVVGTPLVGTLTSHTATTLSDGRTTIVAGQNVANTFIGTIIPLPSLKRIIKC